MSSYTERQTEQIVGTVVGVVQKNADSFQAQVVPDGSTGTRNLWTKRQEVVQYLLSQVGNRLAFVCSVSEWERNGQPVRSLWIEQVGSPTVQAPVMQGPPMIPTQAPQSWQAPAPTPTGRTPEQALLAADPKQGMIHRQTATKVAALLLAYLPESERTMSGLLMLAERLKAYYDTGLPHAETVEDLMHRAMPQGMEPESWPNPDQYTGDDDIPF